MIKLKINQPHSIGEEEEREERKEKIMNVGNSGDYPMSPVRINLKKVGINFGEANKDSISNIYPYSPSISLLDFC